MAGSKRQLGVLVAAVMVASAACALPIIPGGLTAGGTAGHSASPTGPHQCAMPTGDGQFQAADPSREDLDPNAVANAILYAQLNLSASVRIYRHDCLVGTSGSDPETEDTPQNMWSATKGVVSMLVGRAVTIGKLAVDDPIGKYLPQADVAHAAITVRELLTQSSGLAFHWLNDVMAGGENSVDDTLGLSFVHQPGTYFEYAQTTITTLGAVVQSAVGEDLQTFADQQLFTPLGIPRARWSWGRDLAGNTQGYALLAMAPIDMARLGELLLHDGRWGDRQLIASSYVHDMAQSSPNNHGYGYLLWTNHGDDFYTPSELVRTHRDHPWIISAPRDLYGLSGLFDQFIFMIPSLDMVIVRTGAEGSDPWVHEFFRTLMRGVEDQHIPDPGPAPDEHNVDLSNFDSLADFATLPALHVSGG